MKQFISILLAIVMGFGVANAKKYNQEVVDTLNSRIADLQAQVNSLTNQVTSLQSDLNDCNMAYRRARQQSGQTSKVVEVVKKVQKPTLEIDIFFDEEQSSISPESLPLVERIASCLKNDAGSTVDIKGFTSMSGLSEENQKLSEARAQKVKSILVTTFKISESRITVKGCGEIDSFSVRNWNNVAICKISSNN